MLDTGITRVDNQPQVTSFPRARSGASLLLWQPADLCCSVKVTGVALPRAGSLAYAHPCG